MTGPHTAASIVPKTGMALYVHVPFCNTKCPYCDFNTYQGIERLMGPYLDAVTTETRLWGSLLRRPAVTSVFLGGGTPSYLSNGYVDRILASANEAFRIDSDAEITMEANPGDLDVESCGRLSTAGINRLSLGVQSLDDGLLRLLGRRHDADQAMEAFQAARRGGFRNINLDLMYGLPRQTMAQWETTLQRLVSHGPEHISMYALTLEDGTPLQKWVEMGRYPEPDPDLAADMYHYAEDLLEAEGYHHYEISNWCLPGMESRHNMAYWLNQPYLGVGPGAHSSLGSFRFWDVSSPVAYIEAVKDWGSNPLLPLAVLTEEVLDAVPPVDLCEFIDEETQCFETMFLGLRLLEGMDLATVSTDVGCDLATRYRREIQDLVGLGLLEWDNEMLRLTKPAYLIANQVFTRFVA